MTHAAHKEKYARLPNKIYVIYQQLLQLKKPCRRYTRLRSELEQGEEYKTFRSSNSDIFDVLIKESGIRTNATMKDIIDVFDAIRVQVWN